VEVVCVKTAWWGGGRTAGTSCYRKILRTFSGFYLSLTSRGFDIEDIIFQCISKRPGRKLLVVREQQEDEHWSEYEGIC
jgi:hypothetical protein